MCVQMCVQIAAGSVQCVCRSCLSGAGWCKVIHMMTETQQAERPAKVADEMRRTQRPAPNGSALPVGRPKGTANKVTRTIREAVEMAAAGCHPQGLAGWLIERAQGGVQDRQIFAGLVSKALPLQVHAQVGGGIRLELGWLSGRQVGPAMAQVQQKQPQVIDLQPEPDGMYRIVDPAQQQQAVPVASEGLQGAGDACSTIPTSPPAPSA